MSVVIASKSTASASTSGNTLTVTKPTGLAANNLLVAFVSTGSGGGALTGWTAIGSPALGDASGFGLHMDVLAKVADSSDAAASDFTFTMNTDTRRLVHLFRITGDFSAGVASLLISDNDNNITKSGSTFTFPGGVTPFGTNSLLLFGAIGGKPTASTSGTFSNYAVTNNNPTWTEEYDVTMPAGGLDSILVAVASATYSPVTSTGAYLVDNADAANEVGGKLVSISEVQNVTVSPTVVSITSSVQAPSVTGGANVSPSVVTVIGSVQSPTVSAGTNKWSNKAKTDTSPTIVNKTKS